MKLAAREDFDCSRWFFEDVSESAIDNHGIAVENATVGGNFDRFTVAKHLQNSKLLLGRGVPQANLAIPSSLSDPLAVGTPSDAGRPVFMPFK
ncbi:hypothetical protein CA54_42190 [Symmachiella macrocystis]|uniref:Uncharacterized protein n=1 Tax=Symmachiella macrocystis TaxID=2527985 RepID=A0A5C6BCF4_9PLAN|nr:hypothetical protein CA54_42190 [Symmachiella macrocystis]